MSESFSFPYKVTSIVIPDGPYYVGDEIGEVTGVTNNGNIHIYSWVKPQSVFISHDPFTKVGSYEVKAYYRNGHNGEILETSKTVTVQSK